MMPTREFMDSLVAGSNTNDDVEESIDQHALPVAAPLLEGVTTVGDTALHVTCQPWGRDRVLAVC
jgi:hypothetical protein